MARYVHAVADYVRNVSAKVGDPLIVHGAGGEAPTWENAKLLLPEIVTGKLADRGVGTRHSRQSGGRVPARAIMFSAPEPNAAACTATTLLFELANSA